MRAHMFHSICFANLAHTCHQFFFMRYEMRECYSGYRSQGDRCDDDDKLSNGMMDRSKQRSDDGNKHAADGTKLLKTRSLWSSLKRRRMAAASPSLLMVWIIIAAQIMSLVQPVHCGYITVVVITEEFNLNERPHAEIVGIIHGLAANAFPRLEVQRHPFLGPKDPQPAPWGGDGSGPSRWIQVPFRGETDDDRATIALADNNLSLVAFMNNIGTWHCFSGYENMFPDCVVLNSELDERGEEWDESYPNLIDGGVEKLHTVPLGEKSDKEATRTLGHYRHGISPLPELKQALLRKMIMYPEAVKVRLVRETFSGEFWETETYLSPTEEQAKLLQNWGFISALVWRSDCDGGELMRSHLERKKGMEAGITSLQDALNAYYIFRRPKEVRINIPLDE